jgi:hypothetical protein
MLKLTSQQLEFLVFVVQGDDWNSRYFLDIVSEHYNNGDFPEGLTLSKEEFDSIMQELSGLSVKKIDDLQLALSIFGSI